MRIRLAFLLAAAALSVAACQPAAAPPAQTAAPNPAPTTAAAPTAASASTSAPAATAPATAAKGSAAALHVSYSNLIATNLPEWLAYESGIFKQNGLDVTLDNIASSTGIPALLSGQTQIAHLGGSESLSAAAQGGDLVVIAVTNPTYPFVFMAPGSITDVQQLKGKKIGVSNIGSSSDIATRVMLNKVGLDPEKDVGIVAVGSLENRIAALFSGAIDGGVAQPPDQLALEDKGFHVVYDLAAQHLPSVGDCIVVQRMWLNTNNDIAQRYIDSIVQAIALSKKNKEQSVTVLGKYLKNNDQRALDVTYSFFVGSVMPDYPVVRPELFADSVQQLAANNEKIKSFDLKSIVNNSLVQSAMDRHVGP